MISKPKVTMRLHWESKDTNYDRQDRKRFTKIKRIVNKVPVDDYKNLFIKNKNYWFYKGFCYGKNIKETLNENEFDVLLAVIDNIKNKYYDRRYEDEEV